MTTGLRHIRVDEIQRGIGINPELIIDADARRLSPRDYRTELWAYPDKKQVRLSHRSMYRLCRCRDYL